MEREFTGGQDLVREQFERAGCIHDVTSSAVSPGHGIPENAILISSAPLQFATSTRASVRAASVPEATASFPGTVPET